MVLFNGRSILYAVIVQNFVCMETTLCREGVSDGQIVEYCSYGKCFLNLLKMLR